MLVQNVKRYIVFPRAHPASTLHDFHVSLSASRSTYRQWPSTTGSIYTLCMQKLSRKKHHEQHSTNFTVPQPWTLRPITPCKRYGFTSTRVIWHRNTQIETHVWSRIYQVVSIKLEIERQGRMQYLTNGSCFCNRYRNIINRMCSSYRSCVDIFMHHTYEVVKPLPVSTEIEKSTRKFSGWLLIIRIFHLVFLQWIWTHWFILRLGFVHDDIRQTVRGESPPTAHPPKTCWGNKWVFSWSAIQRWYVNLHRKIYYCLQCQGHTHWLSPS